METNHINEQRFLKAKKKVKKLKEFYKHLVIMLIALPVIIFINLVYVPQFHWFWIPVCAMTFSLIIHWISSFGFGKNWEENKIEELMKNKENQF